MVRVLLHGGFDKLRSELEVGRRGCFRSTIRAYFSLCCAGWNVAGWNITMKNTSRRKNPKELLHPSPDDGSNSQTRELLQKAKEHLNGILTEEHLRDDISLEVEAEVNSAITAINDSIRLLNPEYAESQDAKDDADQPTHQQGQFLAFIREYMTHNYAGLAPSHADLQRYFNLTPPSVNSMLIRLEVRGFIRRIPRKTRAIEITIDPNLIPALDRPFKFGPGSRIL